MATALGYLLHRGCYKYCTDYVHTGLRTDRQTDRWTGPAYKTSRCTTARSLKKWSYYWPH